MYGSEGRTRRRRRVLTRLKAHVGVDSKTKLIHTILASAANVADAHALRSCPAEWCKSVGI